MRLAEVQNGKAFKVGEFECIKFSEENGRATIMLRSCAFNSTYGKNDFSKSRPYERLVNEFLPKFIEAVGEENICEFETDLTALDGTSYGTMKSKVSLPTLDFYRANRKIFDEYKINTWFWLSTADSTNTQCILCVAPSGVIVNFNCNDYIGVRPFCILNSSISVS